MRTDENEVRNDATSATTVHLHRRKRLSGINGQDFGSNDPFRSFCLLLIFFWSPFFF